MPNLFAKNLVSGGTFFGIVRDAADLVWAGTGNTFADEDAVTDWAAAAVPFTPKVSIPANFAGTFPASVTTPGPYTVAVYRQAGGSPALSDVRAGPYLAVVLEGYADGRGGFGADVTTLLAAAAAAAGVGADRVTVRLWADSPANTVPLADADVWVTGDAGGSAVVAGTLQTNSAGEVMFLLDEGVTYHLWMQKDGVNPIRGAAFVAAAD